MSKKDAFSAGLAAFLVGLTSARKRTVVALTDSAIIAAVSYLTLALHFQRLQLPSEYVKWLVVPVPFAILPALQLTGVYDVMMRFWSGNQLLRLFEGTVIGMGALFLLHWFQSQIGFAQYWNIMVLQAVNILLALAVVRYLAASMLRPAMHRPTAERVLIYGAGRAGTQLAAALMTSGEYWPVAFVDDRKDLQGRLISGIRVFAPERMTHLHDRLKIRRVLLAVPSATHRRRAEIVQDLEKLAVKVMVMPGLDDLACGRKQVSDLREVQVEDLLGRDPVQPDAALLNAFIRNKVVLITGAGGSIGSELCRQVIRQGATRLVLFEISEPVLYQIEMELQQTIAEEHLDVRLVPVLGNVLDGPSIERVIAEHGVTTIYHAAAYKHVPLVEHNPFAGIRNNVFGALEVIRAAVRLGVQNFVLVSSDKAVRPTSVMGATKRLQEMIVQAFAAEHPEMRFSMVRFGNVLASSGSVVPRFREQIRRGGPVTVTHADITRFFMTIPEAAELVIQAGAMGKQGDLFVLDMGAPVRIVELAARMIHLSGLTVRDAQNPNGDIEIAFSGLRPGEKLYEELLIGDNTAPTSHPRIQLAREAFLPWSELSDRLDRLGEASQNADHAEVAAILRSVVQGYKNQALQAPAPVIPAASTSSTIVVPAVSTSPATSGDGLLDGDELDGLVLAPAPK